VPSAAGAAGVERYLEDLWRDAPWPVALGHTLTALAMCAVPLALGRTLRPFPSLSSDEQGALVSRMLRHPWYPVRLLGFTVRGNALVAALRDPAARAAILGDGDRPPASERPAARAPGRSGRSRAPVGPPSALEADYVVVGSGAAGATVAVALGEHGRSTIVLEEGGFHRKDDFTADLYGALATLFRDFGAQVARGRAIIPVLEGRCVGGSTVMNGAITHRLPKEIHDGWCEDAAIASSLPFSDLEKHAARIEEDLGIRANLSPVLEGLPAAAALRRLGWAYQPMRRSAPGCQASGRCLQGCPSGGKLSMEASYIPRAIRAGAILLDRHRATRIVAAGGRATGLVVRDPRGGRRLVSARKAVILAAGALQSPLLLRTSGLGRAHVGGHFQCHLGAGTTALLDRPVRSVEGPPQGIEVFEFDADGIKLATQLLPPELLLARTAVAGGALSDLLRQWRSISCWTGSVRSEAEGRVSGTRGDTCCKAAVASDALSSASSARKPGRSAGRNTVPWPTAISEPHSWSCSRSTTVRSVGSVGRMVTMPGTVVRRALTTPPNYTLTSCSLPVATSNTKPRTASVWGMNGLVLMRAMDCATSVSRSLNDSGDHDGLMPVSAWMSALNWSSVNVSMPQSVWWIRMISVVPSRRWLMVNDRISSSVTTPPALRMTCASPSFRPRTR